MTTKPSTIVRQARKKLHLNQKDFAVQIGKTQSVLSRYESGSVEPPSRIIMHCMNILNTDPAPENTDSVDEIIQKIRALNGDQFSKIRKALNILLDELVA